MGVKKHEILALFRSNPNKKFKFEDIVKVFKVTAKPRKKIMPFIQSLMNTGEICKDVDGSYKLGVGKKQQNKKMTTTVGRFVKNQAGFGFVITQDHDDVYLDKHQVEWNGLMNGDMIKIKVDFNSRQKKYAGTFIEFVSRRSDVVVGKLVQHHGGFAAQIRGTNELVSIQHGMLSGARKNDWIEVEIKKHSTGKAPAVGEVKKVIDDDDYMVIRELGIRDIFQENVIQESRAIKPPSQDEGSYVSDHVMDDKNNKRRNLCALDFVTIDGEDAKDFDDAVYLDSTNNILHVAIADVSHYVNFGMAIDKEAYERATSVYFPDKAIPMLPKELSEEICCLRPNVFRYVLDCEMHMDTNGNVKNSKFYPAVIKSKARLTYTKVQELFNTHKTDLSHNIKEMLLSMLDLYRTLRNKSKARGTIFMNIPEAQIFLNDDGSVKNILQRPLWDSHSLIEEFMIAANIEAAKKMKAQGLGVYRVHAQPDPEKLKSYAETASLYKVPFDPTWKKAKDFSGFLDALKSKPTQALLNRLFLRSLKKAEYSNVPEGHFALALLDYTHFTSPIRRYPDLMVHRLIKGISNYTNELLQGASEHCSDGEIKAQAAERSIIRIKQARYLEDKLDKAFAGEICGFNEYGIFVQLKEVFIEGYLPFSRMGYEMLTFDELRMAVINERGKIKFSLGDDITVYVNNVDIFEGKIEFTL